MSDILARRLRRLVQAVLTSRKPRHNRRALRVAPQAKLAGAGPWRLRPSSPPGPPIWGRALALQPVKSRRR